MQGNQLIGRGRTADVFSWKDDRVLKLYYTFIPARVVEQEFRATRAAAAAGLPVPAADELVEVEGRHGIIFERVHGPSMLRLFSLQPWRMGELARLLAELHAHVHAVAAPEGLPAQHPRIADGIRAGKGLTEPEKDAALARLAGLPVGDRLCHGDFHPDNILMTARGPMIIDWPNATRGLPAADFRRTLLLFATSALPAGQPLLMRLLGAAARAAIERGYRRRFGELCPDASTQAESWTLPLMAERLREVEGFPAEKQILLDGIRSRLPASGLVAEN